MTDRFRFVLKPFLCGVLVLLASVTPLAQTISSDPSIQGVDAYAIPFPRTARVVLDTSGWQPFAGGSSFGDVGPYEQLTGRAHLAFDSADAANAAITDLALVAERYLLAEDVTRIVEQAGEAYDQARAAR